MSERIAASPSRSFIALSAAFIAGVAVHAGNERVWFPVGWPAALAVAVLAAALTLRRRPAPRLALAAAGLMMLGLCRYDAALAAGQDTPPPPEARRFVGTVAAEPSQGIKNTVLIMDRVFVQPSGQPVAGRARLSFPFPSAARYGDRLSWECGVRPSAASSAAGAPVSGAVPGPGEPSWQCFLRRPPALAAEGRASPRRLLYAFKERLRRVAGSLLPEPESSFLLGLLIGERRGLPPELVESFRRTGTSHILAVSGYNVSKLVDIFFIIFACAAVPRRRAAALVALSLLVFAAVVGGGASVVRAVIMGCVSLLAVGLGRRYHGQGALLAAAAAMLAADPLILRHDVGFQLSFAAVWGLHALGGPLTERLTFVPETLGLRRTLAETLAATLMTMPVVLQAFGRLPLAGPLVNLLILPLIPWAMFAGALAVLFGSACAVIGLPPAWLTTMILRLIETVVGIAASIPALNLSLPAGPAAAAAIYSCIALLWFALTRAGPRAIFRRPRKPDIEVEVTDHGP